MSAVLIYDGSTGQVGSLPASTLTTWATVAAKPLSNLGTRPPSALAGVTYDNKTGSDRYGQIKFVRADSAQTRTALGVYLGNLGGFWNKIASIGVRAYVGAGAVTAFCDWSVEDYAGPEAPDGTYPFDVFLPFNPTLSAAPVTCNGFELRFLVFNGSNDELTIGRALLGSFIQVVNGVDAGYTEVPDDTAELRVNRYASPSRRVGKIFRRLSFSISNLHRDTVYRDPAALGAAEGTWHHLATKVGGSGELAIVRSIPDTLATSGSANWITARLGAPARALSITHQAGPYYKFDCDFREVR